MVPNRIEKVIYLWWLPFKNKIELIISQVKVSNEDYSEI